jgi:hypothetical protein
MIVEETLGVMIVEEILVMEVLAILVGMVAEITVVVALGISKLAFLSLFPPSWNTFMRKIINEVEKL